MSKTKRLSTTAILIVLASTILGLYGTSLSNAAAPNATANPVVVYWTDPQFVEMDGQSWIYTSNLKPYQIMWSPSGQMLLLVVSEWESYGPTEMTKVVLVNASNMEVIHKFAAPMAVCDRVRSSFAISPDETKIFFANSGSDHVEIVSVNLNGSNPTPVVTIPMFEDLFYETIVDFARDGMFLIYTESGSFWDSENYRTVFLSRIKKFDFNTNETTLVLEFEGYITSLKVSPSNDKIAFTLSGSPFGYGSAYSHEGIYIVNLDGTNLVNVTSIESDEVALWINWASNEALTYTEVSNAILNTYNEYEWAPPPT